MIVIVFLDQLGLSLKHEMNELFVVEAAFAMVQVTSAGVQVHHANHLIDLLVAHLVTQLCHALAQLTRRNVAAHIPIEDLEGLNHALFRLTFLDHVLHQLEEFFEINLARAVSVHLLDHKL